VRHGRTLSETRSLARTGYEGPVDPIVLLQVDRGGKESLERLRGTLRLERLTPLGWALIASSSDQDSTKESSGRLLTDTPGCAFVEIDAGLANAVASAGSS
jgi:hypothetical protein